MKEPIKQYKPTEKIELPKIKEEFPKVFKKVSCPSCGGDPEQINLESNVANCSSCSVIFSIEEEIESLKVKPKMKQAVLRPEGIDLFYFREDLQITLQPHIQGLDAIGLGIFLPTSLFAIFAFLKKGISIYFPLLFVMGALYFIYKAMNYHKYKTYIDVNDESLTIRHRPKNFKSDKTFSVNEIDQVYLKKSTDDMDYVTLHMVVNSENGQQHQKLLTVDTLSKAKYLEQEIEKYLGIEDRKVPEANA